MNLGLQAHGTCVAGFPLQIATKPTRQALCSTTRAFCNFLVNSSRYQCGVARSQSAREIANRRFQFGATRGLPVSRQLGGSRGNTPGANIGSVLSREEAEASASSRSEMSCHACETASQCALLRLQNMLVLLKDLNLSNSVGFKVC